MKIATRNLIMVVLFLLVMANTICFAALIPTEVILNQNLKITYNSEIQRFKNVKGEIVYPISYEGTTYLPIRSISSLFETAIKWDGETKSIYLGSGDLDTIAAEAIPEFTAGVNQIINVDLNEDIKIYYNDNIQTFKDVNGKVVYPLSYNGTTYLPVRAISNLYDANIEWNAETYTVSISKNEYINEAWEGKYVSNVDGYTEVVLTHNDEGLNFYLRGYKLGSGIAANANAIISGDVAIYETENFETEEMDRFELRKENSKLVISVTNKEHKCFEGEYALDDGSLKNIVLSNPEAICGIYQYENVKLELIEVKEGLLDATFAGPYGEDGFFSIGVLLDYANGIATYTDEAFGEVNKIDMEINGDTIIVKAASTEENSAYKNIGGNYKFVGEKVWSFEECKNQVEEIYVSENCFMY